MAKFTSDQMYDIPWITTHTGTFNLDSPTFDIRDIAHALPMICRFNGQIRDFYSVGQHSLIVCQLMDHLDLGNPLEGLLHDATEAYLSDVPSPFKHRLPDWRAIDDTCERALRAQFGIGEKTEGCKTADWLALYMEAYAYLPGQGEQLPDPHNLRMQALALMKTRPFMGHYTVATDYHFTDVERQFLNAYETWV